MKVASFFAGCGGLDLGFEQAGYDVIWANEFDEAIHETYQFNHPNTYLCKSDIRTLKAANIPDCDGFIGGPPCQSWSEGGKQLGLNDERGRLFLDYIQLIKEKRPQFFIIENVQGIISDKHFKTFLSFLSNLECAGYVVSYSLLNAADYRIPQDRFRVFIVGFIKELDSAFRFPEPLPKPFVTLQKAIGDITEKPRFYNNERVNQEYGKWINHDTFAGPFDAKFMARNRIRAWNEVSFTIQAQAKNCPLHPQAPTMKYISPNQRAFLPGCEHLYRRLSVRECARIQTFPDKFRFFYTDIKEGYKMVGNAVPPRLARSLALSIKDALNSMGRKKEADVLVAYYKDEHQLRMTLKNKLYYVRTGFRRGALQMPVGVTSPKYLLLHNQNNRFLYAMVEEHPKIMSASELFHLGFAPSGNEYLTFKLEDVECINIEGLNLADVKLRGKKRDIAIPYIASIQELFS
ncbi:DNA cytosine methyltransferase [Parabacteroides chinchillae]|uniref:Cytosine-specific methyltransferase n=1 Tax=Parabacteroides chinchillae TaxID=871327 RepID=A0A8G2BW29_9BACT|nr:DNA cytosine methyltransferase [Parabacteroides chinchillae]SEF81479.1 DNA (cytosine-5)-methyltransferase 1 [Parabacteroides chinchillae]